MEIRFFSQGEVRAETVGGAKVIQGRVVKYNAISPKIGGAFHERILRGAFDESLRAVQSGSKDCYSTWNHDVNMPLGRTSIHSGPGSLELSCDAQGLNYRCEINDTTYAQDLYRNVQSGVVRGFSWGMEVPRDGQTWEDDSDCDDDDCEDERCTMRSISKMNLIEASPVLLPAYDPAGNRGSTNISVRSFFSGEIPMEIRSRYPQFNLSVVEVDSEAVRRSFAAKQMNSRLL